MHPRATTYTLILISTFNLMRNHRSNTERESAWQQQIEYMTEKLHHYLSFKHIESHCKEYKMCTQRACHFPPRTVPSFSSSEFVATTSEAISEPSHLYASLNLTRVLIGKSWDMMLPLASYDLKLFSTNKNARQRRPCFILSLN